jgi:hypothetical protein
MRGTSVNCRLVSVLRRSLQSAYVDRELSGSAGPSISDVSSTQGVTKEIDHVNRPTKSAAGLLGLALLLGSVASGCARHGGSTPEPVTQATPVVAGAGETAAPTATVFAAPIASPSESPVATATPVATQASATANPKPTADPLDSELQTLNQLLNGIDTSLSGSDSSTTGGE